MSGLTVGMVGGLFLVAAESVVAFPVARLSGYDLSGYDFGAEFDESLLSAFVIFSLVFTCSFTVGDWFEYLVAKLWLAGRGVLPLRLMRFLDDAHHRGVLRQVGATYRFRHARLESMLAARVEPRGLGISARNPPAPSDQAS
ncbi:hypothetical protein [Saccharothrix deserti]|uniref:hypothetical protein n=1 Tax=Saccharothrix deserti TaxID=2593674 RepID=UPI00131E0CD4|nr:hypothetical protein [Saccharothrix deserti]